MLRSFRNLEENDIYRYYGKIYWVERNLKEFSTLVFQHGGTFNWTLLADEEVELL